MNEPRQLRAAVLRIRRSAHPKLIILQIASSRISDCSLAFLCMWRTASKKIHREKFSIAAIIFSSR
jgi:hypothetical protein